MNWRESDREDKTIYKVVMNHEEQYSIWPEDRTNPLGWQEVGVGGSKDECLAYIKKAWTDMRPLSLRKQMEQAGRSPSPVADGGKDSSLDDHDLVKRLSEGAHPLVVSLRTEKSARALKERIDLGSVHLRFTDTQGETELGVRLDLKSFDLDQADFENQTGVVHLEGNLSLDYQKVRCIAGIDLRTLTGEGRLIPETA